MALQLLQPVKKEDALDKILKGLSIADKAFNIPVEWQQYKQLQGKNQDEQKLRDIATQEAVVGSPEAATLAGQYQALGVGKEIDPSKYSVAGLKKSYPALSELIGEKFKTAEAQAAKIAEINAKKEADLYVANNSPKGDKSLETLLKGLNIKEKSQHIAENERKAGEYSQDQNTAATHAQAMVAAQDAFQSLLDGGFNPAAIKVAAQGALPPVLEGVKSDDVKSYTQAKDAFIGAVLRKQSGAAINKDEYNREDKKYFPQAGDSEKVQEQKAKARNIVTKSMIQEAAGAFKPLNTGAQVSSPDANKSVPNPSPNQSDPNVAGYAKEHGLDYISALKILTARGYGKS